MPRESLRACCGGAVLPRVLLTLPRCLVPQTRHGRTCLLQLTQHMRRRSARTRASATATPASVRASTASRATRANEVSVPALTPRPPRVHRCAWPTRVAGDGVPYSRRCLRCLCALAAVSCPNDCSGHGKCVSLSVMATEANGFPTGLDTTYGSDSTDVRSLGRHVWLCASRAGLTTPRRHYIARRRQQRGTRSASTDACAIRRGQWGGTAARHRSLSGLGPTAP